MLRHQSLDRRAVVETPASEKSSDIEWKSRNAAGQSLDSIGL
ncbi:hypothetical protein [Halopiger xanaduensis]|nr:hypothetical protein [Halopiger xanaduensis]